jgi:hypothetical protein
MLRQRGAQHLAARHTSLLAAMGKSDADIAATIAALHREVGLDRG